MKEVAAPGMARLRSCGEWPVSDTCFDPAIMALRGRIGGLMRSARHDGRQMTAPARAAFLAKLEHEADPNGELPPEERRRRAEALRLAHLARARLAAADRRRASRARPGLAVLPPTAIADDREAGT